MNFDYHMPTRILFGPGRLNDLANAPLPGSHALIVIAAGGSMKRQGYLKRVEDLLDGRGVAHTLYDRVLPNPTKTQVMEGATLARQEKCDFVIGLGGGSSIDAAKAIAVMAVNPGDYWDYVSGGTAKGQPVLNGALPIVAITTTAGTGTEADPWTVVTNEETKEKIGFGGDFTFPALSIVDPELMLTVPPKLTAYQGFDALFHAVEGYIATCANPIGDAYALKSIELIGKCLPTCVSDGSNLEARTAVALANTLSGFVETASSCTSEHSMEHALSALHPDLPHGAGLIMLSKAYFTRFATVVPKRYTAMARALRANVDQLPETERPLAFVHALVDLQRRCGVDQLKMSDYGIRLDEIPALAENAHSAMGGLFTVDPARLSHKDTVAIMSQAYR